MLARMSLLFIRNAQESYGVPPRLVFEHEKDPDRIIGVSGWFLSFGQSKITHRIQIGIHRPNVISVMIR